jgi:O-antigen/teichoic acid export membrane protein
MFAALLVAGFLHYASNVVVGKLLGPEKYGIYAALLAIFLILYALVAIIQTTVAGHVSHLLVTEPRDGTGPLLKHLLSRLLPLGLSGGLVFALMSPAIAHFLHIPSLHSVIILGLSLVPIVGLPIVCGIVQGQQRFGVLGGLMILAAVLRLGFSLGLIYGGFDVAGAVASLPLHLLCTFAVGLVFLGCSSPQEEKDVDLKLTAMYRSSLYVSVSSVCFMILSNLDMVVVKSVFAPLEAGYYAAIANLGKVVLHLPDAVTGLLLPKASRRHAMQRSSTRLLRLSLMAVGSICGVVTLFFWLFPSLTIGLLFGEEFLGRAYLLGPYGVAITFYALTGVWLYYYIAVRNPRYTYLLMIGVLAQAICLGIAGARLSLVVLALLCTSILLFVAGEALLRSSTDTIGSLRTKASQVRES